MLDPTIHTFTLFFAFTWFFMLPGYMIMLLTVLWRAKTQHVTTIAIGNTLLKIVLAPFVIAAAGTACLAVTGTELTDISVYSTMAVVSVLSLLAGKYMPLRMS